MNAPAVVLEEAWQYRAAQATSIPVMPDGCQDLICITPANGPSRWLVAPLTDAMYWAHSAAGDSYRGWRLRPGALLQVEPLLRAVAGRDGGFDPLPLLAEMARLDVDVADALTAFATCGQVRVAARFLGVSERSLSRRVQQATRRPPVYWCQLARARRAAQGLAGSDPLAAVAADCGYADQAHLTRAMRRWFGATPEALRVDAATLAAINLSGY